MMTIAEFFARHVACDNGRDWAVANCRDMNHAWETLRPDWLLWVATRPGVLDDRTLRMFAVWCARQVQHLMRNSRSLAALDVAERHAHGQATDAELAAARDAAWAAALAAAGAAAAAAARAAGRTAGRTSAWDAAWAAAWAYARDATRAYARDAGRTSAWDAAWDAASAAARAAQAAWLRQNAKPCFDGGAR